MLKDNMYPSALFYADIPGLLVTALLRECRSPCRNKCGTQPNIHRYLEMSFLLPEHGFSLQFLACVT